MKTRVALLGLAVVIAACSESAFPTATKPGLQVRSDFTVVGGCPGPFTITGMQGSAPDGVDRNGDGYVCSLTENGTIVTWVDNNVPVDQIGGCPNGFAAGMGANTAADRNGDGVVCTRTTGNGNVVVIDNNHRP